MAVVQMLCVTLILSLNVSPSLMTEIRSTNARKTSAQTIHPRLKRDNGGDTANTPGADDCQRCAPIGSFCPVGTTGPTGPQGVPGRDGRDGRDAPVNADDSNDGDHEARPTGSTGAGAIFVRWGREDCPSSSVLVYRGVAGGAHYTHTGSGSNYMCMPEDPIYDEPIAGSSGQERGLLYGGEYQTNTFAQWNSLYEHDVPCAVCLASDRQTLLMIPARNICPTGDGWVKEYSGYLVSGKYNHQGRTEFICMDRDPRPVPRSVHNSNGVLFYAVEGRCGSSGSGLPCGPYVDGYELTCAVCTM